MAATNLTRMPSPRATRHSSKPVVVDPQVEKLFYRRHEASYALGLPLRSIDYMISDHRLTTRRHGRSVLIPASDVRRIAAQILRSDLVEGNVGKSGITVAYAPESSSQTQAPGA